jgi:hypothetical protein
MLVAASMLAAGAISIPAALYLRAPVSAEPVVFLVDTPPLRNSFFVSVSPDGRTIAYAAQAEGGRTMVYLRPIGSLSARLLAGTEDAFEAFWSPDSRYLGVQIGYGPNSVLKRVDATGGPLQTIARCGIGTWNPDGVIVCEDGDGLSRVSAAGGTLTRITTPDKSLHETGHRFPHFLPDGRHFLYLAWSALPENRAIYVGALDSDQKTRVMTTESRAVYTPPGHLLFYRQTTLFAQAFDATRLALDGEPVRLVEGIHSTSSGGHGRLQCRRPRWCTEVKRSASSPGSIDTGNDWKVSDRPVLTVPSTCRQTRSWWLFHEGCRAHQRRTYGRSTCRLGSLLG